MDRESTYTKAGYGRYISPREHVYDPADQLILEYIDPRLPVLFDQVERSLLVCRREKANWTSIYLNLVSMRELLTSLTRVLDISGKEFLARQLYSLAKQFSYASEADQDILDRTVSGILALLGYSRKSNGIFLMEEKVTQDALPLVFPKYEEVEKTEALIAVEV